MHARKAHGKLNELSKALPNLDTYTKAAVLIDGLLASTSAWLENDERPNEIVRSKLRSARGWFEILCGIGEDGNWTEDHLRDMIRADLYGAEMHINRDGLTYTAWPAVDQQSPKM